MAFEKYTKVECDYGQGDWPRECGTCAHYTELSKATHRSPEGQGKCRIVVGRIGPTSLCKFHVFKKGKEPLEDQEGRPGEIVGGEGTAPIYPAMNYEKWAQKEIQAGRRPRRLKEPPTSETSSYERVNEGE